MQFNEQVKPPFDDITNTQALAFIGDLATSAEFKKLRTHQQVGIARIEKLLQNTPATDDIPVAYVQHRNKLWIFIQSAMTLQCAYCIHIQQLRPVRNNAGLVTHLKMAESESHSEPCPQSDKKEADNAGQSQES